MKDLDKCVEQQLTQIFKNNSDEEDDDEDSESDDNKSLEKKKYAPGEEILRIKRKS